MQCKYLYNFIELYPIFLFFFYFVWRELRKRDTEPEIHFDYILWSVIHSYTYFGVWEARVLHFW